VNDVRVLSFNSVVHAMRGGHHPVWRNNRSSALHFERRSYSSLEINLPWMSINGGVRASNNSELVASTAIFTVNLVETARASVEFRHLN